MSVGSWPIVRLQLQVPYQHCPLLAARTRRRRDRLTNIDEVLNILP